MKKFTPIRKILWAVDPLQRQTTHLKAAAQIIDAFAKGHDAKVEVAYVHTLPQSPIRIRPLVHLERPFLEKVEDRLRTIAHSLKTTHEVKIITQTNPRSKLVPTQLLSEHARAIKADLIAVSTHGQSGLKRFFMGSFAEDLLLSSPFPLLLIGPHVNAAHENLDHIIVPVDFSKNSRKLFSWAVDYAKYQNAHLTVFHGAVDPFAPLVQPATMVLGGTYPFDLEAYSLVMEKQRKTLESWVSEAEKKRVKASAYFYDGASSLYHGITEVAEKTKQDLIVMGTQHGAMSSALVGSVTRQVIRHASVPVLAMRI